MEINIYEEIDELLIALADVIVEISAKSIAKNGRFNFVLSGGSSPKKLYELLASEGYRKKINWAKTYFFFGDERYVPEEDSQRNSLMAEKSLFKSLNIRNSSIFLVDTLQSPSESAKIYAEKIKHHFKENTIVFDFVLLGLGDDAHTASLFPQTDVLNEQKATIKSVFVTQLDAYRITMTAPLIKQANYVAFLVYGENKAEAVYNVIENTDGTTDEFPAKLIVSQKKAAVWFIDNEASSLLKNSQVNNKL